MQLKRLLDRRETMTAIRVAWLILVATILVVLVPSVHATLAAVTDYCKSFDSCSGIRMTREAASALQSSGISLQTYADYCVALILLNVFVVLVIATLMMRRPSSEPMLLFSAFVLVLVSSPAVSSLETPGGAWSTPASLVNGLGALAIGVFLYIFPNGRFVPRWSILSLLLWPLLGLPLAGALTNFVWVVVLATILASQVYRYRRVSNPEQRQQTKLVVFGIICLCLVLVFVSIVSAVYPDVQKHPALYLPTQTLTLLASLPLNVSIGVAILRYRLWDVDQLVSRTLVYLVLTLSLIGVYLGLVIGLQSVFRLITGQQSQLAIAISTLAIAALFNPLRYRLHNLIARAFYRSRYDAAHVLSAFGATCREQTDLDNLRAALAQVVKDTLEPQHVSVWLREG